MSARRFTIGFDRALTGSLGWLFLAAGVVVMGGTLLLPAYLECRDLQWRQGLMDMQAHALAEQAVRYEQLLFALETDDPVLLERLAYHHFRLKPLNASVITFEDARPRPRVAGFVPLEEPPTTAMPLEEAESVEAWLHQEMPVVGRDYPALIESESRLVRLTNGPTRLLLFAAGAVCLALGLTASEPRHEQADDDADDATDGMVDGGDDADAPLSIAAPPIDDDADDLVAELDDWDGPGGTDLDDEAWEEDEDQLG